MIKNGSRKMIPYWLKHMLSFLTQMDNFGKLHMAASPILVDATDTEAVVAFTLHAVAGDLS